MPPGASGESQCTCARGPTSGVLPRSGILSAAPKHGILVPIADAFARILPCGAAWARTPHDTCSPTWSGIGSDKHPTLDLLHWSSSHVRRILLPERSNLLKSHWSNQWLTNFS